MYHSGRVHAQLTRGPYSEHMRWALPLLTACGLVACAAPEVPTPTVQLLAAPVSVVVGGRVVSAQAQPILSENGIKVRVQVGTGRALLPDLTVTGVYVVTDAGVWKSPVTSTQRRSCASGMCQQATASGSAAGFRAGQRVQVVTRIQDPTGQSLWLRDADATIRTDR